MTYKPTCTMNMERMLHVKIFYNRKEGITPEEFNRYWSNEHAKLATPFHLRIGVVKYSQVRFPIYSPIRVETEDKLMLRLNAVSFYSRLP